MVEKVFRKDLQYVKFCAYGFLKNLRFFEPYLYLFFLEKGISYLQIGVLVTIREVVRNLFEVPSGVIADALGRRRTMIASFGMYILSFALFFFADRYGFLVVAMFCYAVGDAFRTGTHKAMIFTWLEINGWADQKVNYYGHTRSWSQRGSAVSSLLAAAVVFWSGEYRMAFLFSVIPYLLDLGLMISYPPELEGFKTQEREKSFMSEIRRVFVRLFSSLRTKGYLSLLFSTSLYSGLFHAIKDYYQPILAGLAGLIAVRISGIDPSKLTAWLIGGVYFMIYLGTAQASARSGKLTEKFTDLARALNTTMMIGFLILLFTGLMWWLPYPWKWAVIVLFFLIFILENLRRPIAVTAIAETLPEDILATTLSVESQTRSLIAAVLAPAVGFVVDKLGIGSGLIAAALLMLLLYPLARIKRLIPR